METHGIDAVLHGGSASHTLHGHIESITVGQFRNCSIENFIARIEYNMVGTEFLRHIEFLLGNIANRHFRTAKFRSFQCKCADCTGSNDKHPVARIDIRAADSVLADAERLHSCKRLGRDAFSIVNTLQWHTEIGGKSPVSLAPQRLVMFAAVYISFFAWIALSAVVVGISCYDHPLLDPVGIILIDIHNFG